MPTRWILTTMDRKHDDVLVRDPEIQRVGKSVKDRSSNVTTRQRKRKSIFNDPGNCCIDFGTELVTKPGAS